VIDYDVKLTFESSGHVRSGSNVNLLSQLSAAIELRPACRCLRRDVDNLTGCTEGASNSSASARGDDAINMKLVFDQCNEVSRRFLSLQRLERAVAEGGCIDLLAAPPKSLPARFFYRKSLRAPSPLSQEYRVAAKIFTPSNLQAMP
jgi:hypothetical protein